MKLYSFIYSEVKRTPRRTYGGTNYTLAVYEVTGGKVVRLGEVSACTAAHKGEASEAWSVVLEKRPNILKIIRARALKAGDKWIVNHIEENKGYHCWQFREFGVSLQSV